MRDARCYGGWDAAGLGAFDEGLLGFAGVDDEGVVIAVLRPGAGRDFAEVDEFPVGHVGALMPR